VEALKAVPKATISLAFVSASIFCSASFDKRQH
jgi:hypothetical protein